MTAVQYFEYVLDDRWKSTISNRNQDVPKPEILIEGSERATRVDTSTGDYVFVVDGGAQDLTPKSFSWAEEENENQVSIDVRTSHSRERFEGYRDDNNAHIEYSGLRGEIKRIIENVRKGDEEYDLITGHEWRDLSGDVGFGFWRGVYEVRLRTIATEVNPP